MTPNSEFNPNPILSFLNPIYLVRSRLFKNIESSASLMSGRLLDFGCGSKPYQNLFDVSEYVGIDIAVSGHDHADSKVDIYYDGKHIPFASEYFDSVFSSEVFEHVFNIDEILQEISRVLKVNGKMLISIPFFWPEHEQPFDFGRYTSFGIAYTLQKNGFEVIQLRKSGHFSEVILQMILLFLHNHINPKNRISKGFVRLIIFSPIFGLGYLLTKVLPKDDSCFFNLVIVAKKISK